MPYDLEATETGAAPAGGVPDPEFPPARLEHLFTYHPPSEADVEKYRRIRAAAQILAEEIVKSAPSCPDRSTAIRKVREAVFSANSAIALKGRS